MRRPVTATRNDAGLIEISAGTVIPRTILLLPDEAEELSRRLSAMFAFRPALRQLRIVAQIPVRVS